MALSNIGPVVVRLQGGNTSTYPWATSTRVDRKGGLHVYGNHRQHVVFLDTEWNAYVVSAAVRVYNENEEEDA